MTKLAENNPQGTANIADDRVLSVVFPITKLCHCDCVSDRYYSRNFINQAGFKVHRIFYKCRNCKSRIFDDFIPAIDKMMHVNVMDLLNNR